MMLRCPVCFRKWDRFVADDVAEKFAKHGTSPEACDDCAAERRAVLACKALLSPPTDHLIGSQATILEIPALRTVRPHSSGRRVVRKSSPMAG